MVVYVTGILQEPYRLSFLHNDFPVNLISYYILRGSIGSAAVRSIIVDALYISLQSIPLGELDEL
jgi:hypothetical protein